LETKYVRICSWARETAKVQLNDVIGSLTAMPTAIDFDSLDFRSGWNMSVPNISDTFATFPAMWADVNDDNDSSGECVCVCVRLCVLDDDDDFSNACDANSRKFQMQCTCQTFFFFENMRTMQCKLQKQEFTRTLEMCVFLGVFVCLV